MDPLNRSSVNLSETGQGVTPQVVDVDDADVQDLLTRHFRLMRSLSPAESCHVMETSDLKGAGAHVFGLRSDGALLAIAALTTLAPGHGELKSMHTRDTARGRGIGQSMLAHVLQFAQTEGLARVSLETGSADHFAPARLLYEKAGFEYCPPFGTYVEDPLSVFMTRAV